MQNSSILSSLYPTNIIEAYLNINLNASNRYLSISHKNDKCKLLAKSIFECKKNIETKDFQQNKLFIMIIEDLVSDKILKPLSLVLSSHHEYSSAPLENLKTSSLPNQNEDVFISHLHFIENLESQERQQKRFKVEMITAIFFERISSDISKSKDIERFHRNALANALEWHRKMSFSLLNSSSLKLQFHFPQSHKDEQKIPKVGSQEIEKPGIVPRSQNPLDKRPSRRKLSLPKSPPLAFSTSDSHSLSPGRTMTTSSESSPSPRSPLSSPKNILSETQPNSFESQHKLHPFYIELIKQLSSNGLEYCRQYCQYKLIRDKQGRELVKDFRKKINENDVKIICTPGFLKMFLMRFLIQENIEKSLSNSILPDKISGDIDRHLDYVFIIVKGKKLFHFIPHQNIAQLEGEEKEQAVAETKCTNFSILLKMMIRLIDKPSEADTILGFWQKAVYQESLNGMNNQTFRDACETFLEDLRANISFLNHASAMYQFYSLMTAQTQIAYTKPSMAVRLALPHAQLEECKRSFEYDFTLLPNIKLQVCLTLQSHNPKFPPFQLVILNGLTSSTTNPGSWNCHMILEIIPIVHRLENEKIADTATSDEEVSGHLPISLEKQKQIHESILKPLIDLGFIVFMQKDSLGRILKKISIG